MRNALHRAIELFFGMPMLLLGGLYIYQDIQASNWAAQDPEHRRVFHAWPFAIVPFMLGCWLVFACVVRLVRAKKTLP